MSVLQLEPWQWVLAAAGAFSVGFAKSGIPGFGLLFVAIFAAVFPAKVSVGLVLPMLILGDLAAIRSYRQHTQWRVVLRLLPWTVAGIVVGRVTLDHVDNRQLKLLIGGLLLGLIVLHLVRQEVQRRLARARAAAGEAEEVPRFSLAGDALVGTGIGFATMTANAAGPLTTLYFLACRLPKYEFLGTAAWFYCLANMIKVPFAVNAGLITRDSIGVNLALAVFVFLGSFAGWWVVKRVNQKWFEWTALALTAAAALHLLVSSWLSPA